MNVEVCSLLQFLPGKESGKTMIILCSICQGALPQILEKTTSVFFIKALTMLRKAVDVFYREVEYIPCLTCPQKPEGAMFCMVPRHILIDSNQNSSPC